MLVVEDLSSPEIAAKRLLSQRTVATASRIACKSRSLLAEDIAAGQPCGPSRRGDRGCGGPQGGFAPAISAQGRAPDPVLAGKFREAPDPSLVLTLRVGRPHRYCQPRRG